MSLQSFFSCRASLLISFQRFTPKLPFGSFENQPPSSRLYLSLIKFLREALQLKKDCKLILGEGDRIRFWEDIWCGENPLCTSFPTLYAVAASKGAKVGEVWETTGGAEEGRI